MPDLTEAELAELERHYNECVGNTRSDVGRLAAIRNAQPSLISEVRRLRAENAELRVTHEPGKEPTTSAIELEKR